jgi:hypothetical protein
MPVKTLNLTDIVDIIFPYLPENLVSDQNKADLRELARKLPPVFWAGFEIRLSGDVHKQVDFHQGVRSEYNNPEVFLDYLEKSICFSEPVKQCLYEFCKKWSDSSTNIGLGIEAIGLEFDLDLNSEYLSPAFFIAFKKDLPNTDRFLLVQELSPIFKSLSPENLEQFFINCEGGEYISHIGIMLSRETGITRVNIRNLSPERLRPYLEKNGYHYSTENLEKLFSKYIRYVDRIILCLDTGDKIYPRTGLECTLVRQPQEEPRYKLFLDELTRQKLCTSEKAASLAGWAGWSTPVSDLAKWPEYLLAESLLKPPEEFSLIDRTLSHIKVDCFTDDTPPAAKAYLSFEHKWYKKEDISKIPAANLAKKIYPNTGALDQAINRAVQFLLNSRNQAGWWRDYGNPIFPESSDEWITAYTGYILSNIPDSEAIQAAKQAWKLLSLPYRSDCGWGWSPFIMSDADSTAWALRLAKSIKAGNTELIEQGNRFLKSHQREDGGIAAYERENFLIFEKNFRDTLAGVIGFSGENATKAIEILNSSKDWYDSHTCVTAAAATINAVRDNCLKFLQNVQQSDGSWHAFWWPDPAFATALAVNALAESEDGLFRENIGRAVEWAANRIGPDGSVYSATFKDKSPFATASCLKILLFKNTINRLEQAVEWLLADQKENGGWQAAALLYMSPPESIATDINAIHTTATVLEALNLYRNYRIRSFKQ